MPRRRGKAWNERKFNTYIYKVLKQVHPDTRISGKAMTIMDSFVKDILDRVAIEACMIPLHAFCLTKLGLTLFFYIRFLVRDQSQEYHYKP